jgi:hypothetical protein
MTIGTCPCARILSNLVGATALLAPALGLAVFGPDALALARNGDNGVLDARAFTPATDGPPIEIPRNAPHAGSPDTDEVEVRLRNWRASSSGNFK